MPVIEASPVFEQNFDGFMNYLQDVDVSPSLISPKRYVSMLKLDMQTLAENAHVHRNTISRAPGSESVQKYLRDSVRVIRAASDVSRSIENAIYWFKNNPIPAFNYKTSQDLVSEGRVDTLIQYIESLHAGFTG